MMLAKIKILVEEGRSTSSQIILNGENISHLVDKITYTHVAGSVAEVTLHPDLLDKPLSWKKPRRVFVNSMSDLFHEDVPLDFILRVWKVMAEAKQHKFLILTKRPERMYRFVTAWLPAAWGLATESLQLLDVTIPNVWLGVSVEDQQTANKRIPLLLKTPAAVRFVSCEPLLDHVDIEYYLYGESRLDWVIIGGESGPGARPMELDWAQWIVNDCKRENIPVFVKQLGGYPDKRNRMEEWPESLRVREWPE
jgi:protein gp37